MEQFHVERKENTVYVNREPETQEEMLMLGDTIADALCYAFMLNSSGVIYPNKQGLKNIKTV